MVILAILITVVLVLWFFKPEVLRLPDDTQRAEMRAEVRRLTDRAATTYEGWRGKLRLRSHQRELARQFKAWVSHEDITRRAQMYAVGEGFSAWLAGLSDAEVDAFSRKVALYCAGLNLDLAWLVNPRITNDPGLQQALEGAVILYSVAYWRSNQVQRQVRAFLALQSLLSAPGRKANRALGQKLYAALVENGLTTAPPDLFLAPEKQRQAEVLRAIQEAAEGHRDKFNALLLDLAAPSDQPPSAATVAAGGPPTFTPVAETPATAPESSARLAPHRGGKWANAKASE